MPATFLEYGGINRTITEGLMRDSVRAANLRVLIMMTSMAAYVKKKALNSAKIMARRTIMFKVLQVGAWVTHLSGGLRA